MNFAKVNELKAMFIHKRCRAGRAEIAKCLCKNKTTPPVTLQTHNPTHYEFNLLEVFLFVFI